MDYFPLHSNPKSPKEKNPMWIVLTNNKTNNLALAKTKFLDKTFLR